MNIKALIEKTTEHYRGVYKEYCEVEHQYSAAKTAAAAAAATAAKSAATASAQFLNAVGTGAHSMQSKSYEALKSTAIINSKISDKADEILSDLWEELDWYERTLDAIQYEIDKLEQVQDDMECYFQSKNK